MKLDLLCPAGDDTPVADMRFWLSHAYSRKRTLVFLRFKCEAGAMLMESITGEYEAVEATTHRPVRGGLPVSQSVFGQCSHALDYQDHVCCW